MGPAIASLLFAIAAPSVSIDAPAEIAAEVRTRVERELETVEWADEGADLELVIGREGDVLSVRILEGEAPIETRSIDATDPGAASRVVALLLVDAIERWRPPPEPPPPPPSWRLAIAAEGLTWGSPSTAQNGASLAAARRIGPVWVGARIAWRRFCCTIVAEDIEANARTLSGTGEVRWDITKLGQFEVGLAGALGVANDRVEATAIFPGGRGPPDVTAQTQVAARATAWAAIRIEIIEFALAGGVWVQGSTLRVRLPAGFEGTELSRGIVAPYLAAEIGVLF